MSIAKRLNASQRILGELINLECTVYMIKEGTGLTGEQLQDIADSNCYVDLAMFRELRKYYNKTRKAYYESQCPSDNDFHTAMEA